MHLPRVGFFLACLTAALSLLVIVGAGAAALAPDEAAELAAWGYAFAPLATVVGLVHVLHLAFLPELDPYGSMDYPPYLALYPHNVEMARRVMRWTGWTMAGWAIPALLGRPGAWTGAAAHAALASAVYLAIHWGLRRHHVFAHPDTWTWELNWTAPTPVRRVRWAKGIARICDAVTGPDAGHAFAAYGELRRELLVELQAWHALALYGVDLDDTVRQRLTAFLEAWPARAPASPSDPVWLALQAAARVYVKALPDRPRAAADSPSWPRRERRRKRTGVM